MTTSTVIYRNKKTGHFGVSEILPEKLDKYLRNKRKSGFDARKASKKEADEKREVFNSINKLVRKNGKK